MRPLPRLHAITDGAVLALPDLPVRAAAIAAAGPPVALHVRDRSAPGAVLVAQTRRFLALARPAEASVFVNGRPDIAGGLGAHGIQLGALDLDVPEARQAAGPSWNGWIGRSVHSLSEAEASIAAGAEFLLAGSIYHTPTHPGVAPAGLALVSAAARLGLPVIAIGGITRDRIAEVIEAGAYGVASVSALWHAGDPAAASLEFLERIESAAPAGYF